MLEIVSDNKNKDKIR